ncbi:hypothetical protein AJ79_05807 [Helicocarpus griseus UAMH5409]|uniref:Prion-inhibition and propagation HeLo domain-containing protein n=1 Tax=Helicocarpus griseus UAMH5409 TaxID=1447875 RepID=A0A2B7XK27_9EURO|nr:hypothetical protein AJ79_05807 [Helicocarpus griseus UAMH5409]
MATSISTELVKCFQQFKTLISSTDLDRYESEVQKVLWEDELGRLRIWASNIGAHQTGQSSLDFRLRDSSPVKNQVIGLLKGLQETFRDLYEAMEDPAPDDTDWEPADEDGTEIQHIYRNLVETITCLMRMTIVIRRPAQRDRILGTKRADAAVFEPFDRQYVSDKFSRADERIVERLGAALSRRRAILKYRKRHKEKLKKGIDYILHGHPDTTSTRLSDTGSLLVFEDTASNSDVSQTSYAQTLLTGGNAVTIPPAPKESIGGQFEQHLGRHLEELALFVMPRTSLDDGADSNASSKHASEDAISEVGEDTDDDLDKELVRFPVVSRKGSPDLTAQLCSSVQPDLTSFDHVQSASVPSSPLGSSKEHRIEARALREAQEAPDSAFRALWLAKSLRDILIPELAATPSFSESNDDWKRDGDGYGTDPPSGRSRPSIVGEFQKARDGDEGLNEGGLSAIHKIKQSLEEEIREINELRLQEMKNLLSNSRRLTTRDSGKRPGA